MGSMDKFLNRVNVNGWTEKNIAEYFELTGEGGDHCSEDFYDIRSYREGDAVSHMLDRAGGYNLEQALRNNYNIKVAEKDGVICGVIATSDCLSGVYIGAVAVTQETEGMGCMGNLIKAVSNDGESLVANVAIGNVRAFDAFERYGFREKSVDEKWRLMIRDDL